MNPYQNYQSGYGGNNYGNGYGWNVNQMMPFGYGGMPPYIRPPHVQNNQRAFPDNYQQMGGYNPMHSMLVYQTNNYYGGGGHSN